MELIEKEDLQGIIIKGYAELPASCFILLKITDNNLAKQWIKKNIHLVTSGAEKPLVMALNIAFTFYGLKALGLENDSLCTFPIEFEDGMTTRHRQEMLGDYGTSDPINWNWGGKNSDAVHLMLMLYANNEIELKYQFEKLNLQFTLCGLTIVKKLDATNLIERKEHFGFHDGIAQPTIKGLAREDASENTVAAGEFILGYKNEYDQYADCPAVGANLDNANYLPPTNELGNTRNLGKNGTYLVFRQLEQNVGLFWKYMESKTANDDGSCNTTEMIRLASKAVGRWPSGAPLVLAANQDNLNLKDADNFGYKDSDINGMKCPYGAHIRRTNPRDSIDHSNKNSVIIANKHRILRRGRAYGFPVAASMNPNDIIESKDYSGERGLYFICVNADFSRQFEFIQNFWVNNPKFEGLYDERDPIIGNYSNTYEKRRTGTFSIPDPHLRKRYNDVPEFVTVKGGAYFFLPGIKALSFLSSLA